ncbi:sugar O-acetyltransferase [Amycolatopsis eburnea]|uniref:Acetyltransferase n=1 Tax=Amycolatopsis eburnea TaxID=2267691 RepID=A0A3R9DDT8_9PSEU|nr:sugar O-acetyltransferase [Amycolatopsis eburnea]RSD10755.1 sugar O-acetyltransferase [Amycolatopsis eburnea]
MQLDDHAMKELMLAGEYHLANGELLSEEVRRAQVLLEEYNRSSVLEGERRRQICEELFGEFGEGAYLRPPFYCNYGYQTKIGARSFANFGVIFLDVGQITIGEDVLLGSYSQLLAAGHTIEPESRRAKWGYGKPITIGDNVWLGAGSIVGPGVTIGENAVIGANSVVMKDIPANVVAVGAPARVIRTIEPGEDRPFDIAS